MATNAKRENPEHLENSELEVLRAKIKKLEQKNLEFEATVKAKTEELQLIRKNQLDHHESDKDKIEMRSSRPNALQILSRKTR